MRRSLRLPALGLALAMLCSTGVHALTPEQALELLNTYYIGELPAAVQDQTTIEDMVNALGDPYTQYFTPEEYRLFTSSMEDARLVGIGGVFVLAEEGLRAQRIFEGSAAGEAGLLPGDVITSVDGQPLAGLSLDQAGGLLRGEEGTTLSLTYVRDGVSARLTLVRRAFVVPTVYTELWEDHIGYLDCDTFGEDTLTHIQDDLTAYDSRTDRWVLDLRDNPGGDYGAAMEILGCLTGAGAHSYLMDGQGNYISYPAESDSLTGHPLLVLTNAGSASAAELLAAGIRDSSAGLLIGARTYGKGVAQSVFDQARIPAYFPDGDALKITTYRFFSSSGTTNHTVGVIPHLMLDQDLADEAAVLLSASPPDGDTAGYLKLIFSGTWYVELEQALSPAYREAFTALLEALPDPVQLWQGIGGTDGWTQTSPSALAGEHELSGYLRRGFSDSASSPFGQAIDLLATYGILRGTGDGAFRPEDPLTRAQLCALLAQALNCGTPTGESAFTDVSMDDWYGPAVNALAAMGLVNGVGGGRFSPDQPVTHEQFVTIMGRLAQWLNLSMDLAVRYAPEDWGGRFDRWAQWAGDWVWLLTESQSGLDGAPVNLLWNLPEDIDPQAVTLREEAAALTCTLLQRVEILPAFS